MRNRKSHQEVSRKFVTNLPKSEHPIKTPINQHATSRIIALDHDVLQFYY